MLAAQVPRARARIARAYGCAGDGAPPAPASRPRLDFVGQGLAQGGLLEVGHLQAAGTGTSGLLPHWLVAANCAGPTAATLPCLPAARGIAVPLRGTAALLCCSSAVSLCRCAANAARRPAWQPGQPPTTYRGVCNVGQGLSRKERRVGGDQNLWQRLQIHKTLVPTAAGGRTRPAGGWHAQWRCPLRRHWKEEGLTSSCARCC